jgi:quercetin dioxygenase-like cupin family protein
MHSRSIAVLCASSFLAGAGVVWAQQQAQNATRRVPQFENQHVKVWKSIIMPNQPLVQHRHEHGRALIALTDGRLHVVDKNAKDKTIYDWKAGTAYWLDADPPGETHADVNRTSKPIEVIVVELQKEK